MIKRLMRTLLLETIMIFFSLIVFYACQEEGLPELGKKPSGQSGAESISTTTRGSGNRFSKKVGATISAETGKRWLANYSKQNTNSVFFDINAEEIAAFLDMPGCIGISFCFGRDEQNAITLSPVGIDTEGRMMRYTYSREAWDEMKVSMDRYTGSVRSRFFGADALSRLIKDRGVSTVRAWMAIDDGGDSQLLLDDAVALSGCDAGCEDESFPCPTVCPIE